MPGCTAASFASGSIDVEPVHVAGEIEDHGHVGALAGEAGACAARQHGGPSGAAGGERGFDVGRIAGKDDADGKLAVVRGVGGVERARARIEENVAAKAWPSAALRVRDARRSFRVRAEAD